MSTPSGRVDAPQRSPEPRRREEGVFVVKSVVTGRPTASQETTATRRETCRRCGAPVTGRRRSYCSDACYQTARAKYPAQTYRACATTRRKQKARMLAYYHLRHKPGAVIRPCEACGSVERVEMAHHDYRRPFDVRWLCKRHHVAWDKERVA